MQSDRVSPTKLEARVSHLSLSDKAYNLIKEKLISCDEGEYLSIREMSEQIGMSYTPVREAFQRLAKEGLLEQVPKLGFFVRRIDIRRISEIFQVRECLELFVLERVFDKRTRNTAGRSVTHSDTLTKQRHPFRWHCSLIFASRTMPKTQNPGASCRRGMSTRAATFTGIQFLATARSAVVVSNAFSTPKASWGRPR